MALSSILSLVLYAIVALAMACFVAGIVLGARSTDWKRTGGGIALTGFILYLVIVGGSVPLARQIGAAVTDRAASIVTVIVAALVGGFGAGIKRRRSDGRGFALYVVATGFIVATLLVQFDRRNRQVADAAAQLGIDRPHPAPVAETKSCRDNLKHIYDAMVEYASNWDALPPARNWMDNTDMATVTAHPEWLHCPAVTNGYGYAYNEVVAGRKLSGKPMTALPGAATTPLLYDSTELARNAHDAFASLPHPGRHQGKSYVVYVDGHVAEQ